ncbi:MAG: hypothetical protein KJ634_02750 [Gammaproteobacteria bacterium]|nr:hypothetical protein [Gammaproteobacteria bacterium]MBU1414520.1 hypothetical protein [Gammaproteobacteria bacterium]
MKKSLFLLALLVPAAAMAEGDVALTGKVGTLGFGLDLNLQLTDSAVLRFGGSGYDWSGDTTDDGIRYDATFRTSTASVIGDFFPIQDSTFRLSLGLFYNGNKLDMNAKPDGTSGTYEIGDHTYTATEVGELKGTLTFNKTAPYIGVGWGNAFAKPNGWGFMLDIGALYQGQPKLKLESSLCNSVPGCPADLAIEQDNAEKDLRKYRWYPVVSAGAVYRF